LPHWKFAGCLLRFREDLVGFAGDISKMYQQILLPERDTHVHGFPVVKSPNHETAHQVTPVASDLWGQTITRHGQ